MAYHWNGRIYRNVPDLQKVARDLYPDYFLIKYFQGGFRMIAPNGDMVEFTKTIDEYGNTIVHDRIIDAP